MMLLMPMLAMGQKIEKNEIDKFTKQHIIETKREKIVHHKGMFLDKTIQCSIRKVNEDYRLTALIGLDEIERYEENSGLTLLFDNGEIVFLPTLYTGIGSEPLIGAIGGEIPGIYVFSTVFELSPSTIDLIRNNKITDIRISVVGKLIDCEVPKKNQDKLQKMLLLVESAK